MVNSMNDVARGRAASHDAGRCHGSADLEGACEHGEDKGAHAQRNSAGGRKIDHLLETA